MSKSVRGGSGRGGVRLPEVEGDVLSEAGSVVLGGDGVEAAV